MDNKEQKIIKKLGGVIRKIRVKKGLTLEDMANFGFSPQHFQKIESGSKGIAFYTAFRIAKAFKIKLSELVVDLD